MKSAEPLDRSDHRILELLASDGRMSWRDLAQQIGLSLTPTLRRVRRLEAAGLISGYTARFDESRLGGGMSVFISVTLERQTEEKLKVFEERIARVPEVMSCFLMTGGADYLLRVLVTDLASYQQFLLNTLTRIPGVAHIQSSFAIKPVVQRVAPPMLRGSGRSA
jgi:DNA-binding Lrp family transcriptional regulator